MAVTAHHADRARRTASTPRSPTGSPSGRRRLGRPLTLAEKILVNHLRDRRRRKTSSAAARYADFDPDRVALQDATAQMALLQFMTAGLAAGRGAHAPCTATT